MTPIYMHNFPYFFYALMNPSVLIMTYLLISHT